MNHNGTNALPLHIHDDNNGLDYTLHGDYYLPGLEAPKTPPLNRWGRTVFDRLQKQRPDEVGRADESGAGGSGTERLRGILFLS